MSTPASSRWSRVVGTLACATLLSSCGHVSQSNGEKLARVDCAACHMFPNPDLLDKKTWVSGVLPQMAPRLGLPAPSLDEEMARSPYMTVLSRPVSAEGWVCRTLLDGCRGSEANTSVQFWYIRAQQGGPHDLVSRACSAVLPAPRRPSCVRPQTGLEPAGRVTRFAGGTPTGCLHSVVGGAGPATCHITGSVVGGPDLGCDGNSCTG